MVVCVGFDDCLDFGWVGKVVDDGEIVCESGGVDGGGDWVWYGKFM